MSDLLIHSMSEFGAMILPCLAAAQARNIAEIGAEFGGMSQLLADHAAQAGGVLTSIDPAPQPAFTAWAATQSHVRHIAAPSLEVIPTLADIDAWVIDGDHNYYSVYHELKGADLLSQRDGRPLLVFLHDVGWPNARRDMYYAPARIPDAYRHKHDFESGTIPGQSELSFGQGFRGGGQFALATHEGGPRNGVLTAIEDFLAEVRGDGRVMAWANIPAVFGLGILFDAEAPWSAEVAALIAPFNNHPLLDALERNRLLNYLKVLEWQDRATA